jgi:hypothetical protein
MEYPYLEAIRSHLAFADEVVVYDTSNGKDKTLATLNALAATEPKLKVVHSDKIDWAAPNHGVFDGYTKTLSRKQCTGDILWQFDVDEIVHENHISLIRPLAETFMRQNGFNLMALPVVDYWGRDGKARLDVTVWKWRLSKNNPDIIKLPTDVPIESLSWEDLNVPGQQWVRRWFTAYCKETLARVRGKYSGNLKTPDSEIVMDYQSLLTEAKDEKTKLIEELTGAEGWLTRMRPDKVMEREALIAENLNKQMKFRAMPRQIYVI